MSYSSVVGAAKCLHHLANIDHAINVKDFGEFAKRATRSVPYHKVAANGEGNHAYIERYH